jgi:hypothetical protein
MMMMGVQVAMSTLATSAFDEAAELPHAAAGAATMLVDITGAARVTTAIERSIIGEAVVEAVDGLQHAILLAAGGDEVVATLLVAVTRSAEWHRVRGRRRFLTTQRSGDEAGQRDSERVERAAPGDMAGNCHRQAIESIRIHDSSPLANLAAEPRRRGCDPAAQSSRYVQTTATGTRSLA